MSPASPHEKERITGKLRVGVIGLGIGRTHITALRDLPDHFEVTAVCDLDQDKARSVADTFSVPRVAADFNELCRMDEVDVVDICTPSFLHYEQTLQALAAGKHIILEKPACGSLQQMDQLIAAEAATDRRILPIFQVRFGRGAQRLRHLIQRGVVGQLFLTTSEVAWSRRGGYYGVWHGRWQTELGGPLVTLAIHAHDVIYSLVGPARRVFARLTTRVNPIETEDCVSASLEMNDGSPCSLSVTTGSAQQITRLRLCFSNLTAESHTSPYNVGNDPWQFIPASPAAEDQIQAAFADFTPQPEGFVGEFLAYYTAMQTGGPLPVPLQDARNSLELITALYASSTEHQDIELPILPSSPWYAGWQPKQ